MKGYDYDLMGAIKISKIPGYASIYTVKYVDESGEVKNKTVTDEGLANGNILSITVRKDAINISMISHPHKYITYSSKNKRYYEGKGSPRICNAKFVLREQLMEHKHLKSLENILDKFDTLPTDPLGLIEDLKLYTLQFRMRLLNDKAGVVIHTKSNALVYKMLIKLGLAEYRRDQAVNIFCQEYTNEQEKQFNRHRIYKVKSEEE